MLKDMHLENFPCDVAFPIFKIHKIPLVGGNIHYDFSIPYSITLYVVEKHASSQWMLLLFNSKIDIFDSNYEWGSLDLYMNGSSFWMNFQVFFVATRRIIKEKCCHTRTNHTSFHLDIFQRKKTLNNNNLLRKVYNWRRLCKSQRVSQCHKMT